MSVEKFYNVYHQGTQLLKAQKAVIQNIREELFLLGKNYDNFLFSEFRKKLRGLIFSVDLEKFTDELNEVLANVETLINQEQSNSSKVPDTISGMLQFKEVLKAHETTLNNFKEAMLELRNVKHSPSGALNQKTEGRIQLKMFKDYLYQLSQQAQRMCPSLKTSLAQQENIFGVRMTVLLNLLSQLNSGNKINLLIQRVLDGFFDHKMSKCKKQPEESRFRISIAPKGKLSSSNADTSTPPIFSFKF